MEKNVGRSSIRREDREVKDEKWIRTFLEKAPSAVVGTSVEDQPFLTNVLFVFDASRDAIFFHTARLGRLRSNIEANPQICLTVTSMGRLLPADTALEFSVEYASVVVFGEATIAEKPQYGLELMMEKYFPHLKPGRDYRPITLGELVRTSVFELKIKEWSAKRKRGAPDHPGAIRFPETDPQLI
jgi:nitroimidazol reductase NimA-like FMN-containing flavoprotein (pyridoxamine 5'-phosphate oxidase superfamily)